MKVGSEGVIVSIGTVSIGLVWTNSVIDLDEEDLTYGGVCKARLPDTVQLRRLFTRYPFLRSYARSFAE